MTNVSRNCPQCEIILLELIIVHELTRIYWYLYCYIHSLVFLVLSAELSRGFQIKLILILIFFGRLCFQIIGTWPSKGGRPLLSSSAELSDFPSGIAYVLFTGCLI